MFCLRRVSDQSKSVLLSSGAWSKMEMGETTKYLRCGGSSRGTMRTESDKYSTEALNGISSGVDAPARKRRCSTSKVSLLDMAECERRRIPSGNNRPLCYLPRSPYVPDSSILKWWESAQVIK